MLQLRRMKLQSRKFSGIPNSRDSSSADKNERMKMILDFGKVVLVCFTVVFTVVRATDTIILSKSGSDEEKAHLEQIEKRARALSRGSASGVNDIGRPTSLLWTPSNTAGSSSGSGWWWKRQ